jgi:hypothetical protein
MARPGGATVFKSASASVLRPGGRSAHAEEKETDPLQAVLNHSWQKAAASSDDHHGHKRVGIASRTRGGLASEMGALGDKAKATKSADAAKAEETARSRLGQTGNNLFVDTGAKSRPVPTFDEDQAAAGESPPTSPGDTKAAGRRGGAKAAAAPLRRYQNDVCPVEANSPRLRDPPLNRKGQVKLNFENEAAAADAEHAQCEVDDHKPHLDPEQQHFVDLCHHFHGACNQAGVRLNEMLTKVRRHFLEDPSWLESKTQFDDLAEMAFEVQTANYFVMKWHHELEPRKIQAPVRPSKIEDMSAEDILAQAMYSTSKLEVLAGKLAPVLEKICYDAKTLRRGANGEPLTPTSKNALSLAKKRGFQSTEEFNKMLGHLEHLLSVAQHLANPPASGLPTVKKMATIMSAVGKFKRGLKLPVKKIGGETPVDTKAAIGGAFAGLGNSIAGAGDAAKADDG